MVCAKIIEIGSSLLKLFKIKLVTFFETRCIMMMMITEKGKTLAGQ